MRLSPSRELLSVGYFFSAATTALMRKARGVTFTPALAFSSFTFARKASSSVMSASSNCVTCGIITQLRASAGPEIFWIRVRGFASIGPNLAKSTLGHAGSPGSLTPPVRAPAAGAAPPDSDCFTKFWMSSLRMRPFGPEPVTLATSTPNSRAKRRTPGLAWGGVPDSDCAMGDGAGAGAGAEAGAGAGGGVADGAAFAGAAFGAGASDFAGAGAAAGF